MLKEVADVAAEVLLKVVLLVLNLAVAVLLEKNPQVLVVLLAVVLHHLTILLLAIDALRRVLIEILAVMVLIPDNHLGWANYLLH